MVSWDHTFTYKNLSLGINLRSWIDFDVFNTINMYYGLSEVAGQNVLRNAYIDNRHIKEVKQLCDYWLEDGTFLKIDAISLGYSLFWYALSRTGVGFTDSTVPFFRNVQQTRCVSHKKEYITMMSDTPSCNTMTGHHFTPTTKKHGVE